MDFDFLKRGRKLTFAASLHKPLCLIKSGLKGVPVLLDAA